MYSRISSVASEAELPFYSTLHGFFFIICFTLSFLPQLLIACLSFLEVFICHVGVLLQNKKLLVLEQVVMCGELGASLS